MLTPQCSVMYTHGKILPKAGTNTGQLTASLWCKRALKVLVVRACKAEPSVNSFTHWVFAESIMFAHILG